MAIRSPKLLERHIQETCSDFLELDGWRKLRTDPVSRREWGKGFGEKGMADCLYLRYRPQADWRSLITEGIGHFIRAEVMWIEWKRERGGNGKRGLFTRAEKAKIHQRQWIAAERKRGALVLLAGEDFPATIEGFMEFYRDSGLCRNASLVRSAAR